jgi:hypothetical protein
MVQKKAASPMLLLLMMMTNKLSSENEARHAEEWKRPERLLRFTRTPKG